MRLRLLGIGLALGMGLAGQPTETEAHRAKIAHIHRSMELTGGEDAADQVFKQLGGVEGSGETLEKFRREFDWKRINEAFIAAYDRNLTDGEILEMIRFYESPVGRKMVKAMPKIMAETMEATSDIVQGMVERLQKVGRPGGK